MAAISGIKRVEALPWCKILPSTGASPLLLNSPRAVAAFSLITVCLPPEYEKITIVLTNLALRTDSTSRPLGHGENPLDIRDVNLHVL